MTAPKRRLPGTTYFVTGVCERHEFRLKPGRETNAAFAVALMEAADRYGVEVVAVCQMSSHYHAVVHDRHGALSDWLRDFHGVMGRFGSARDGVENCRFWGGQGADAVALGDVESVVETVAYTLANPTKDLVVERPERWHGVRTRVEDLGTGRGPVFERPSRFFASDGEVSEAVMVGSDLPWELTEHLDLDTFREKVRARIEKYVEEAHRRVRSGEASFMGLAAARRLSVWHATARPKGREAGRKAGARRTVAAATKARVTAMLASLLEFRRAHRRALERFRSGLRATFPAGTWFAWRFYGAAREDASAWTGMGLGPAPAPS